MKKYQQLTAEDRGVIFALLEEKYTLKMIGERLGFNKSTISREIKKTLKTFHFFNWFFIQAMSHCLFDCKLI